MIDGQILVACAVHRALGKMPEWLFDPVTLRVACYRTPPINCGHFYQKHCPSESALGCKQLASCQPALPGDQQPATPLYPTLWARTS